MVSGRSMNWGKNREHELIVFPKVYPQEKKHNRGQNSRKEFSSPSSSSCRIFNLGNVGSITIKQERYLPRARRKDQEKAEEEEYHRNQEASKASRDSSSSSQALRCSNQ